MENVIEEQVRVNDVEAKELVLDSNKEISDVSWSEDLELEVSIQDRIQLILMRETNLILKRSGIRSWFLFRL